MRRISKVRFDAIGGYARQPLARLAAEEMAWFEHAGGRVLGMVVRDRTDGDFGAIVLAPDEKLRFRAVSVDFQPSVRRAEVSLRRAMEEAAHAAPEEHHQGDGLGEPVDFFAPVRPQEQLHESFLKLLELEGYSPAREIIQPMMRWYEDADGNFVEQFQTTGFDQRIWELYLFAAFIEMGYRSARHEAVPDFLLEGRFGSVAVEAVTVGPAGAGRLAPPPELNSIENMAAYLREYMPIRFGSPLFSKLQKRYWEQPAVEERPLVFAIADFSAPGSMIHTRSALDTYLYGYAHDWDRDADGRLLITPRRIEEHRWGDKVIPSGFFFQPDAENVSAVLFSNSGTISKFLRMGIVGGFGTGRVLAIREGTAVDHDPNAAEPLPFRHVVNDPNYRETWVEGLSVFHNPRAVRPLDKRVFPGAAHHWLQDDGQIFSETPEWHPLASITRHFAPVDVEGLLADARAGALRS